MGSGPEFSSAKGRSALDAVWRRAVNAELAASSGGVACSILMDLRKCYDMLCHLTLAVRGVSSGFPVAILRLSIATYTWARRLVLDGAYSRVIHPYRSIIAGSCFATYQLKVFLRPLISRVLSLHPSVALDFFVDDAVVSGTGPSASGVAASVSGSASDLVRALEADRLGIASEKTAVVSSSICCAKKVARALRLPSSVVSKSAKDLGVDFSAGNRLSLANLSVFGKRRKKARFRVNKVALFAKAKRSASKLYFTGALPESSYGVEVVGASDAVLTAFRRDAAKCLGISGHRRSLDLTFGLMHWQDPAAKAAVAPLVRYAKEVWLASSAAADPSAIKYATLVRGFHSVVLNGKAPRSWGYARGPLGVAHLSARRIGWTFVSPVVVKDSRGNCFNFFQLTPAEVRKLAMSAFASSSLSRGFARLSAPDLPIDRDRAADSPFVDAVVAAFRSSSLNALQSGAILRNFAGGTYLASHLVRMGFQLSLNCPLCGAQQDSLTHRLYACEFTRHLWSLLPACLLDQARSGGSLFFQL